MILRLRVQPAGAPASDYVLDAPETVIGRSTAAAIVVADSRVSRQHARIVRRDDGWWIEDLGARNRTLLNGEPLAAASLLRPGDRLDVGDAVMRVLGDAPDRATAIGAPDRAPTEAGAGRDGIRMRALNEIHRALVTPLSLSELLEVILARCFEVLGPEEGVIMLRGPDGTLASVAHRRSGASGAPVTIPRRLVEEVAGKGQPALVLDAAEDERFAGSQSIISSGIRSVVAAPLVDAQGVVGLIALCSRLAVRRFTQPDLDMLASIASAAALRVRNVALADELASRRIVEHELALAHDVQMAMLPRDLPHRSGLALAAQLAPARSVGGDLYDFVLDGDRLWFIVADVAGKSIAAALYMAIVRTLFRAMARGEAEVAAVVGLMNRELARDNERMMFVTAIVGCLDVGSGELVLVDAGHNPVVLHEPAGALTAPEVAKGTALGVLPEAVYRGATLTLIPGATLVLYTDGLTDARDPLGAMFGVDRLHGAIAAAVSGTPASLVAAVIAEVERFSDGAAPDDDRTLLALRYSGPGV